MKKIRQLLLIILSLVLCITLLMGCNNEKSLDKKLVFTELLDKYAENDKKTSINDAKMKLTVFANGKPEYVEEKLKVTRTVINDKALLDANITTSSISSSMGKILSDLLPLVLEGEDEQLGIWINDFVNKKAFITAKLGFNEDFYNGKLDICKNEETPDWILPDGLLAEGKNPNIFFGLSAKDLDKYLMKFTSFVGAVNPFELIYSNNYLKILNLPSIVDNSGAEYNKGERAFLYTMQITAQEAKTAFAEGLEQMVIKTAEFLKPDKEEEAQELIRMYDLYKEVILKMFSFNPISITAKSDIKGKLTVLDYNLGMTIRLNTNDIMDIVQAEVDDPAIAGKIKNTLNAINLILGSRDGTRNCIDLSIELSSNEKISYKKIAFENEKDNIFAKEDDNPKNRTIYILNKDGELVEKEIAN